MFAGSLDDLGTQSITLQRFKKHWMSVKPSRMNMVSPKQLSIQFFGNMALMINSKSVMINQNAISVELKIVPVKFYKCLFGAE